jgi:hypothetical protein
MQQPAQLEGPHEGCGRTHAPPSHDSPAAHATQAPAAVPQAAFVSAITQTPSSLQHPVQVAGPSPPHGV